MQPNNIAQNKTNAPKEWNKDRALLLIAEADIKDRFSFVESIFCASKFVVQIKNITKHYLLSTLIQRYKLKQSLAVEYAALKKCLANIDYLFLSNTEGFISRNLVRWIRRDFPNIMILGLQHGIFLLENRKFRTLLLAWANKSTEKIFDFEFFGQGFINKNVDYFIVYGSFYKSALVAHGIPAQRVLMSTEILKGKTFFEQRDIFSSSNNNCIFLLQCLSALAITDKQSETKLIASMLEWLSAKYDIVFVKQHPYCTIDLPDMPGNCRIVDGSISDIAKNAGIAVSFFSEALLECEFLGLRTIAIFSNRLKVSLSVYHLFPTVWAIDKNWQLMQDHRFNRKYEYYESYLSTPRELLEAVAQGERM